MSNSFIPRAYQAQPTPVVESTQPEPVASKKSDKVGQFLIKTSQYIVVLLAFLLPVVFMPGLGATLGFSKVLVALTLGLLAIVLITLSALRFTATKTVVPLALTLFWAFVVVAFVSGFLSGDVMDAIRGSFMEPQTAAFLGVMGIMMTIPLVLQRSKIMVLYTLTAFATSVGLLFLYNIIRFIAGPVLPLGSFGQVTSSPAGGLNDLAVFAGLAVVVGLITLLQLPLKRWMKIGVVALVIAAVLVLVASNFFLLWVIVGFFALLFLIYLLARDTLFGEIESEASNSSPLLIVLTLIVCLVSVLFVVAGDFAGAKVNEITGVSYIEVRPSMGATADIIKAVYQEDILLGSGPNRFSDMWRTYKNQSINETNFWNVDFQAGFGLVPTLFATVGLLGGVLMFAFHLAYLYLGYLTLLRTNAEDSFWSYVAAVAFASGTILWLISYIYVPGAAVLLVTALFTGLSFVAYQALIPQSTVTIPLTSSRPRGMLLMTAAVLIVVASVSLVFTAGKQYTAQTNFTNTAIAATSVEEFEGGVQQSYQLYPDERFLNALNQIKINELQQLLSIQDPTEADQARFASIAQQAISIAQESAARDNSSPQPHLALADIYNTLARAGLEGAEERAFASLDAAEERDPLNPSYNFARAYIYAIGGNYDQAKNYIADALSLKSNYTPALFLLAQIAIQEEDVATAIATTRQVVTFEPNNPTRYYQLGILYAANNQLAEAIESYRAAITLDPNYANARYMLGLAYVAEGDSQAALTEFRTVQASNQDNEQLRAVINELEGTGTLSNLNLGLETPVSENSPAANTEDGVVASSTPQTDLISPVNTEATPAESQTPSSQSSGQ